MKKIILFISLILFIKSVDAETFYGEYYKVDEIYNDPLDEIKIEENKLYNTYKINYRDLGYLEENDIYIKDENDYIEQIINSSEEDINSDEYITISTLSLERNTIFLGEVSNNFKVSEIEVYYKGEKINYEINNEHLYKDIEKIKDNNLTTFYENNRLNNNLVLNLKEFYPSIDLKVIIYTEENSFMSFKLYIDNKIPIELGKNKKHIINFINDKSSIDAEYNYLLNKKVYRYYEEEKIPQNIYVKDGENILLDDYIIESVYYRRDKLILNDNLVITNEKQDINDFIEYSNGDIILNNNIDYTKNGIYQCEFILNNLKVEKDIVVDIKDKVETIKSNNKITKNIKLRKDNGIKSLEKTTTKLIKNNTLNLRNETTKEVEKGVKKSYVRFILIILFFILKIIIIYKKKKR